MLTVSLVLGVLAVLAVPTTSLSLVRVVFMSCHVMLQSYRQLLSPPRTGASK